MAANIDFSDNVPAAPEGAHHVSFGSSLVSDTPHLAAWVPNGVSAIQGSTGSITLFAGANITISGLSSSLSIIGPSPLSFADFTLNGSTGHVSIVGSNNITVSGNLSTITIWGPDTVPNFKLNNSSLSVSLVAGDNMWFSSGLRTITLHGASLIGGANVQLIQNSNSIIISAASSATVVSAIGVGGVTSVTSSIIGNAFALSRGTILFEAGNNITLSASNSRITIHGPSFPSTFSTSATATVVSALGISGGNTSGVSGASRGTLYLQGGNNITLSGTGSTIRVVGPVSHNAISAINGDTYSTLVLNVAGNVITQTTDHFTQWYIPFSGTVVSGFGISGGNTLGVSGSSTGTIYLQGGTNITLSGTGSTIRVIGQEITLFSLNGNTGSVELIAGANISLITAPHSITISAASSATVVSALGISGGNTAGSIGLSRGSLYLQGGDNITLSGTGSTIRIIGPSMPSTFSTSTFSTQASATVVSALGISGGNTLGNTGSSRGTLYLQGGSNITLSGNGSTITVIGPNVPASATVVSAIGVSGDHTSVMSGTSQGSIHFVGGNNITLSASNSTITINAEDTHAPFQLNSTSGHVDLIAGNNITLDASLSRITIRGPGTFPQFTLNGSTGSMTILSGGIANVLTLGPNTIQISVPSSGTVVSALGISGGNTLGNTGSSKGTLYLQGGANITLSGNGSTITIIGATVPSTFPQATNFTLNGITASASLVEGPGISLAKVGSTITIANTATTATVVSAMGISGGNTAGVTGSSRGTIYLAGGNNITLSGVGSTINVIGPNIPAATNFSLNGSSSSVSIVGGGIVVTDLLGPSTIRISAPASATVVSAFGVSGGNTTGASGSSVGSIYLAGGSNITLSVSGSTISINANQTFAPFSINGTAGTGPNFVLTAAGAAILQTAINFAQIYVPQSGTVVSKIGLAGTDALGDIGPWDGTIYFQAGNNNITLSGAPGSVIKIFGPATVASATVVSALGVSGAHTAGVSGSSRGSMWLVGGSNITLSASGSTISINAEQTHAPFALNSTTGHVDLFAGQNITFDTVPNSITIRGPATFPQFTLNDSTGASMSLIGAGIATVSPIGANTIQISVPSSATVVSGVGISGGNTLGLTGSSRGTIYLQGGDNITLSGNGSTITIIGASLPSTLPQATNFTLNGITGSASLVSGRGISFSTVGSTITISMSHTVVSGAGISGGNTAGVSGSSTGTIYLAGGNNITLSGIGSTISVIGPNFPAATNFTLNTITGSASIVGGGIVVTDLLGPSTIRISAPASATVVSGVGISGGNTAGVTGSSTGTVYLSGGNNITLSGVGSTINVIGPNIPASAVVVSAVGISGGNTAGVTGSSRGTVYWEGGNNITLSGIGSTIRIIGANPGVGGNFSLNDYTGSASLAGGPGISLVPNASTIEISVSDTYVSAIRIVSGNISNTDNDNPTLPAFGIKSTVGFAAYGNITLQYEPLNNQILWRGPEPQAAFSINGQSGPNVVITAAGAASIQSTTNFIQVYVPQSGTVVSAFGIAGANTSGVSGTSTGTINLQGYSNITLSGVPGGLIRIIGPQTYPQFTLNDSTGSMLLTGGGIVTVTPLAASILQISVPSSGTVVSGVGISGGNTLGVSGSSRGSIYFAGGNNITLSGNGSTITIIGPNTISAPAPPFSLNNTSGSVSIVQGSGISVTGAGSTITIINTLVSGTVVSALGISGGNTAGVSGSSRGTLYLQGGTNITLSGNGSTITIIGPQTVPVTNFSLNGSSSSVSLVEGPNVGFITAPNNITISAVSSGTVVSALGISGGNTLGLTGSSRGSLYLQGGSNITLSGNGSTITIIGPNVPPQSTYPAVTNFSFNGSSSFVNLVAGAGLGSFTAPNNITLTAPASATVVSAFGVSGGNTTGASGSSVGSIYLAGGSNITLSVSGSTISINANQTFAPFSINGTGGSGPNVVLTAAGAAILQSSPNFFQIYVPQSGTVVSAVGIAGGNTSGETGTSNSFIYLQGGNNITLSGTGGLIRIIGAATFPQFTLNNSTGSMSLASGGIAQILTLGANTLQISVPSSGTVVSAFGVSGGNTSGVSGSSRGSIYLAGGNNITLSAVGSTITIIGPNTISAPAPPFSLNNTSGSASIVGGVGIGVTGAGSTITISVSSTSANVASAVGISGGNTAGVSGSSTGTIYLQGGSNITLSGNGSTITVIGASTHAPYSVNGITGSVLITGGPNITVTPNGSTLSISAASSASVVSALGISGGNSLGASGSSTGSIYLIGGTNITLSGAGSSITIIGPPTPATVPPVTNFSLNGSSSFVNLVAGAGLSSITSPNNITLSVSSVTATVVSAFGVSGGNTAGISGSSNGSIYLAGGSNITLSVSGSTISINANQTFAPFSINGTVGSGPNVILAAAGAATLQTAPNFFQIYVPQSGTVVSALGIAGGNTSGETGSSNSFMWLQGGSNITLSGTQSFIRIIGPQTYPRFTLNDSTGSVSVVGAGIAVVTGIAASVLQVSVPSSGTVVSGLGISGGNTSGVTGSSIGSIYLAGGNNITLSGSGSTITIIGPATISAPAPPFSLNNTSGSATLIGGAGIGIAGNASSITISVSTVSATVVSALGISGGNTAGVTGSSRGTIYLQGGNNVTLSGNGSTITVIGPVVPAAFSLNAITGSVSLVGVNNITVLPPVGSTISISGPNTFPAFSFNDKTGSVSVVAGPNIEFIASGNTTTISASSSATVVSALGISGGNTLGVSGSSRGSLYLQGGSNITLSGNGSTITIIGPTLPATIPPVTNFSLNGSSSFVNLVAGAGLGSITAPNNITLTASASATVVSALGVTGNTVGVSGTSNGTMYLAGGSNITLSVSGSTISINANQTFAAFSLNGSSGPNYSILGAGAVTIQTLTNNAFQIYAPASANVVSVFGIAGANTSGVSGTSTGTINLQGYSNITLSGVPGGLIRIIGPATFPQFSFNDSTGSMLLTGAGIATVTPIGASILQISVPSSGTVVSAFGVSGGNTVGVSGSSRGSIYLAGGNNITLSAVGSTISIIGAATVSAAAPPFSLNNTSGSASIVGGAGIGVVGAGSTITVSVSTVSANVASAVGISGGNTSGVSGSSTGSIYFQGGNNITLSGNGSTIAIVGASTFPRYSVNGITGSVSLVASDPNISLISSGNTITISAASSGTVVSALGISGGNTLGVTGSSRGTLYLQGGSNITLSGNGSTITIIGPPTPATIPPVTNFSLNGTSSSVSLVAGAGLGLTTGASSITISVSSTTANVVSAFGVSGGNTVGVSGSSTGSIYLAGGSNITLSVSGSSISIHGNQTFAPFSINNQSGPNVVLTAAGAAVLQSTNNFFQIYVPPFPTVVSALGIAGTNTSGLTGTSNGTMYLEGLSNITLSGVAGGVIRLIGPATYPRFSLNDSTGSVSLVGVGAAIVSATGPNTISISVASSGTVVSALGISGGNTLGVTGSSRGTLYLQGGNNITLSGNGSTITIIGPATISAPAPPFSLNNTSGSVSIVAGAGLGLTTGASSITLSISTVSANVASAVGISGGNTSGVTGSSTGSIYFRGGNNVTLSGIGSTIEVIGPATFPQFSLNGSTGSVSLVSSPNISLLQSGSTITFSVASSASVVSAFGISGGNTSGVSGSSTGSIYLAGGNNITLSGAGSSITIIGPPTPATIPPVTNFSLNGSSSSVNLVAGDGLGSITAPNNITLSVSAVTATVVSALGVSGGNTAGVSGSSNGSIYLAGGSNITLSVSGSTISVVGNQTFAPFSINGTAGSGPNVVLTAAGAAVIQSTNNFFQIYVPPFPTVVSGLGIAGGNTSGLTGSSNSFMWLQGGNNITLSGVAGNFIRIVGASTYPQFSFNNSTGFMSLVGVGAVTVTATGPNTISISVASSGTVVSGLGISGGNSLGASGSSIGSIYLVGGNNITLSGAGSSITIIGPNTISAPAPPFSLNNTSGSVSIIAGAGIGIAGGSSSMTISVSSTSANVASAIGISGGNIIGVSGSSTGSIYFQGTNNISLSAGGSTILIAGPATYAPYSVNGISSSVSLVSGANIGFISSGNTITISAASSATVVSAFGIDGGNTAGVAGSSTGSIYLAGGNNITLSGIGSTISIIGPPTPATLPPVTNFSLNGSSSSVSIVAGAGISLAGTLNTLTIGNTYASATVVSGFGISGGNILGLSGSSTGSIYLAGGNNVTLSGTGSTISIIGPATQAAFSINSSSGPNFNFNAAGAAVLQTAPNFIQVYVPPLPVVVSGVGIAGGNTSGDTGSSNSVIWLQGGNNITLSGTQNFIRIIGPASYPPFSLNNSTGSVTLVGGGIAQVTGIAANVIQVSVPSSATVVSAFGISGSNTLGVSGSSQGSIYLVGQNITLSGSGSTITIIGPSIPQSSTTATVTSCPCFSLNNSGSSVSIVGAGIVSTAGFGSTLQISVPASATVVSAFGISGGNTSGISGSSIGSLYLEGGNNITLSGNGSTIRIIGPNTVSAPTPPFSLNNTSGSVSIIGGAGIGVVGGSSSITISVSTTATNFSLNGFSSAVTLTGAGIASVAGFANTIQVSVPASATVVSGLGIMGTNTSGVSGSSTGTIYLQGGNNVTLSGNGSTINIIGPATNAPFSLNGSSGSVMLFAGVNVGLNATNNSITISAINQMFTVNGKTGSVSLVQGDGISIGTTGSNIGITATNAPFSLNGSSSALTITGAGIAQVIGFASTIQVSVPASGTVVSAFGISGGNTLGVSGSSIGSIYLAGGNNVTLSGSGSTISIVGPATNPRFSFQGISGAVSIIPVGNFALNTTTGAGSTNISMIVVDSGTVVSAFGIAAGNTLGVTGSSRGSIYLAGGNNVTLSGNGSTITIVGANTFAPFSLNGSSGSVSLIPGVNIGFIQTDASRITISAANQAYTLNTMTGSASIVAGDGISIGMTGKLIGITATKNQVSYIQNFPLHAAGVIHSGLLTATGTTYASATNNPFGQSLSLQRVFLPGDMALSEVDLAFGISFPASNSGEGSISQSFALYSFANSTLLNLVLSTFRSASWASGTAVTGTLSTRQQGWAGNQIQPFTFPSSTVGSGEYVVGHLVKWNVQTTNWSVSVYGATSAPAVFTYNGAFGMTTNVTDASYMWGAFSAGMMATNGAPATIDLKNTALSERGPNAILQPWHALVGS